MKVYISSGMDGYPDRNFPAFFEVEDDMKARGLEVINPASLSTPLLNEGGYVRRDFLTQDINELMDCDAIVMFDNFVFSKGAMLELKIALELELNVFLYNRATKVLIQQEVPTEGR